METNNTETNVTLTRTGKPPLRFISVARWEADNEIQHGNRANRWTCVRLYRTRGGRVVVRISNYTCWQGESDHHRAESFATAKEVIDWLNRDDGLSSVAQEALEAASKDDPEFASAYGEDIP